MPKSSRMFPVFAAIALAAAGCGNKTQPALQSAQTPSQTAAVDATAAADGNLAPVGNTGQPVSQEPAAQGQNEPAPAPAAPVYADNQQPYPPDNSQPVYAPQPPPPLPDYTQPPAPGDDYMWTPGYWAWANTGYYWVPGAWVLAPFVDALWTPPYWAFDNGRYLWHAGYWGPYVGYYGGINYGFGYTGRGYYGGYWNNGRFDYNRAVTNVNPSVIHNVYVRKPPEVTPFNHVSYNGGRGGITARATPAELAARRAPIRPAVPAQVEHARSAAQVKTQFASENKGRPSMVSQEKPLATNYREPARRPTFNAQPGRTAQNIPARSEGRPVLPETRQQQTQPAQSERTQNERFQNERGQTEQRPAASRPEESRGRPEARPAAPERPGTAGRPQPAERPAQSPRPAQAARPEPARASHSAPGRAENDKR